MVTVIAEVQAPLVPEWVTDLASFRLWAGTDEFPDDARVCYLAGQIWLDATMEDLLAHVKVKTQTSHLLFGLVDGEQMGEFFGDGAHIVNEEADLSAVPDACFAAVETFERGRIQMVRGRGGKFIELIGIPDWVLEIVSDSSVDKDMVRLRALYAAAGIKEYWIIDARGDRAAFWILRLYGGKYREVRPTGGWLKSPVFGKSFRLTKTVSPAGFPAITMEMR